MEQAKAKQSAKNWPMIIVVALGLTFIVGVWVNSYRVNHAQAAVVSTK